jgi:hypothetical protein
MAKVAFSQLGKNFGQGNQQGISVQDYFAGKLNF